MSFTETHLSQLLELRERACITNNKGFKQANIGKRHHCMSGGHVDLQKTAEHKCARAHTHTARQPHKDTLTDRIWLQRHLGLLRPPSFFPDFSGLLFPMCFSLSHRVFCASAVRAPSRLDRISGPATSHRKTGERRGSRFTIILRAWPLLKKVN